MHPNRGWEQKIKSMSNEKQSRLDRPFYVDNTIEPLRLTLITLFLRVEADQCREFQVCEDCTLHQLFAVVWFTAHRVLFLLNLIMSTSMVW